MSIGKSNNCPLYAYLVSPNPASSTINITANANTSDTKTGFTDVEIFDKMGNPKKKIKYLKNTKSASIDLSALPSDNYVLRIFNGTSWEEHQFIIGK